MMSTVMMERPGMGMPAMGSGLMPASGAAPMMPNMMMVPRCKMKFEKCTGGMKVSCSCDDKMACSMMQNLCTMLAGGMCSCCVMLNGMTVCTCNFTMGLCRCEMTETGVILTCTSGDSKCCEMIQAFCDCVSCLMNAGCTCCVLMNNTPVACGCGEMSATQVKAKR